MKFLTTRLRDISWTTHGFFTKDTSTADIVAGLLELDADNIIFAKQVHGTTVAVLDRPWTDKNKPQADAIVTSLPGIGIGVYTADCVPVLFSAKKAKVIGVAHAGWGGALKGVLEATIDSMVKQGAAKDDITAAIGPAIAQASYEVRTDFREQFLQQDAANDRFFIPGNRAGHLQFDLPGYVADRLMKAGIKTVLHTYQDTLGNEKAYYSFRRSTLEGKPLDGHQFSVIAIKPSKKKQRD